MSQFDYGTIDPNTKSGPQLALDLNDFRDALNTQHKGNLRPSYAQPGMQWVREVSSTQWDVMFFDGDTDYVLRSVNPTTNTLIRIPKTDVAGIAELETTVAGLDAKYVTKDSNTGAANIPVGTSAQRPAVPAAGMFRYNSSLSRFERRNATTWLNHGDMDGPLNEATVSSLDSASVSIVSLYNNTITITGTTTITSLGTANSGIVRRLVFTTALQITHNATSLILPGAANITTAAGDVAEFVSLGSGNWRCLYYSRANGLSLITPPFTKEYTSTLLPLSSGGGLVSATHNFGVPLKLVQATLVFQVAYAGWSVGDECIAMLGPDRDDSATFGNAVYWDNNNIYWRYGSSGIQVYNKTTGAQSGTMPPANAQLKIKVWA